ncbi:MAG: pirin family protein [Chloroflexota bacterium]
MQRTVTSTTEGVNTTDGADARIRRVLPNRNLANADPFVLLDEFFVEPPTGFPEHPHGGFEIITYILEGGFRHKDSLGNDRTVMAGGLQKINAGRGIRHAEMPASEGLSHGLQLWVNLPRAEKGSDPDYEEVTPSQVPESSGEGYQVRIIAGADSPVRLRTPVLYLDVTVQPGKSWQGELPSDYNGFVYVLRGSGRFGANSGPGEEGRLLMLGEGDSLGATAEGETPLHFVLIAGQPHGEPIRLRGSFVE